MKCGQLLAGLIVLAAMDVAIAQVKFRALVTNPGTEIGCDTDVCPTIDVNVDGDENGCTATVNGSLRIKRDAQGNTKKPRLVWHIVASAQASTYGSFVFKPDDGIWLYYEPNNGQLKSNGGGLGDEDKNKGDRTYFHYKKHENRVKDTILYLPIVMRNGVGKAADLICASGDPTIANDGP